MHKDSCACAKSELDLFSVPPTQVEMEKGFWEDIDPITSIEIRLNSYVLQIAGIHEFSKQLLAR